MQDKVVLQPAYILHRRAYRENSFLIDIVTPEYGRVTLVAHAGSKNRSRAAQLQSFQPLLVSWQGKHALKTLTNIEAPTGPLRFRGDIIYSAYYINELTLHLVAQYMACPEVFAAYTLALGELSSEDLDIQQLQQRLRVFELALLDDVGVLPRLDATSDGQTVESGGRYCWHYEQGIQVLSDGRAAMAVSGATLLWLSNLRAGGETPCSEETLRQAKILMRRLIEHVMNGRVLKTRALMKQMIEAKQ